MEPHTAETVEAASERLCMQHSNSCLSIVSTDHHIFSLGGDRESGVSRLGEVMRGAIAMVSRPVDHQRSPGLLKHLLGMYKPVNVSKPRPVGVCRRCAWPDACPINLSFPHLGMSETNHLPTWRLNSLPVTIFREVSRRHWVILLGFLMSLVNDIIVIPI